MEGGCVAVAPEPAPATDAAETVEAIDAEEAELALANTAWEVECLGGEGDGIHALPDTSLSWNFMVEPYSGYSGCNYFLGIYGIEDDTLRLETPAKTEDSCDQIALVNQGSTYMNPLWTVSSYVPVTASSSSTMQTISFLGTMVPLEALPFEGTTWALELLSQELGYW